MIINNTYANQSRYKGKILLSFIMLAFVFIVIVVFMLYGFSVTPVNGRTCSQTAVKSEPKIIKAKTKIGVVKGITYNPANPSALINDTIVYPGDLVREVVVVDIQNDAVTFAKGNFIWQQKVLAPPNRAWRKYFH
ncbi:MAG: hypothetical protein JW947_07275 [Sedimentisphaerales bacterium]|nr:hypothetical protein [Sedimentisphaerales bacterium]